jgi:hypothetical protein
VAQTPPPLPVDDAPAPARPTVTAGAWAGVPTDDTLLRRAAPNWDGNRVTDPRAAEEDARHLTARTPGTNLSQTPGDRAASGTTVARPRPERVAELLSRHERGKREGHARRDDR